MQQELINEETSTIGFKGMRRSKGSPENEGGTEDETKTEET